VDLSCSLSPLVYAELYHRLLIDVHKRNSTEQRLDMLGRDFEWLAELKRLYQTYWQWQVDNQACGDPANLTGVGPRHAQLAAWFTAPLRLLGPSAEFTGELVRSVVEAARRDLPAMVRSPESLRVSLVAWTVGQVRGDLDRAVPVVPAEMPDDNDVTLAYRGLLEHVADLPNSESEQWPEMIGSAILWRVAGIAEGLRPQPKRPNLEASLNALMAEVWDLMPGPLRTDLLGEWTDFRRMRNGFTHVAKAEDGYGFSEISERARKAGEVRLFVSGVTHFVCNEVSQRLATSDSLLGRDRMADEVIDEMAWAT